MTSYWKSGERHWCRYCKLYIAGTPAAIRQHETGARHKDQEERFLRDTYRKGTERDKAEQELKAELERIDRAAQKGHLRYDVDAQRPPPPRVGTLPRMPQGWTAESAVAALEGQVPAEARDQVFPSGEPSRTVSVSTPVEEEERKEVTQAPSGMNRRERRAALRSAEGGGVEDAPSRPRSGEVAFGSVEGLGGGWTTTRVERRSSATEPMRPAQDAGEDSEGEEERSVGVRTLAVPGHVGAEEERQKLDSLRYASRSEPEPLGGFKRAAEAPAGGGVGEVTFAKRRAAGRNLRRRGD
eukprot:Hpha_TRINITY_DN5585_c0_g1::TRINITY_DN5585_c0_g1_i1::g.93738::m.93738